MQWGANLVFWVGDKAIGGKMFALIDLDDPPPATLIEKRSGTPKPRPVISFFAGSDHYQDLLEHEGLRPAPYLAKHYWVSLLAWNLASSSELEQWLRSAHDGILEKLPARIRAMIELPPKQRAKLIRERTKLLSQRATKKKQG